MPLPVEQRLGPYQVQGLIGAGSMGEVYRARDSRLKRDVALKIIHGGNTEATRQRRFEQEARAVSALNHPNIVTVHDVGQEDGVSYLVTELVQGESLRHALGRGPLPMRNVLDIGIQIAAGLAAAHEAGIVHRDLKPENIMLTRDGRVKILDFGLAKETGAEAISDADVSIGNNDTAPGLIVGTTAYMSPEQARSARVSQYSDQFALGLILHEMLTGEQAFKRETPLATLSAILTEEPPEVSRGSFPLRWLIKRCLHKEPDHRYASTRDLLRELEIIRENITDQTGSHVIEPLLHQPAPQAAAEARRWLHPVLISIALVLATTVGFMAATKWHGSRAAAIEAKFVPFATDAAIEAFPAWAPNGRSVAYSAEVNGTFQILVRSTGTSTPVQLTKADHDCLFPFWSPDGTRVYYISDATNLTGLWSVGATGGTPELVAGNVVQASIAPDGHTLAVVRAEPDGSSFALWTGTVDTRAFTRLTRGNFGKAFLPWSYVRFSPDGKKLGAWLSLPDGRSEFWVIPFPNGNPKVVLRQLESSPMAREFAWMGDSNRVVYADRSGLSIDSHLFQADLRTGTVRPLTNGTGSEFSPTATPEGKTIAFSSTKTDYDVMRVGFDGTIEPLLTNPTFEVSPTAAHGQIAYVTDRTGVPEVWLRADHGIWERPIVRADSSPGDRTSFLFDTAFSPDGKRIAYRRAGERDESIWISTLAGDPPVRLARQPGDAFQRGPTWSPDGNDIAYFSMRNGRYTIERARVGGRQAATVIAENAGTYPRWSPKGDWIASIGPGAGVTLVSPDGKQRKAIGTRYWLLHGWDTAGRDVIGIRRGADHDLELVSADVSTGAEQILANIGSRPAGFAYGTALGSLPLRGFTMAPDGRSFYTSMIRVAGDIWTMELSRR